MTDATLDEYIEGLDTLINAHHSVVARWRPSKPNERVRVSTTEFANVEGIITGLELARSLASELLDESRNEPV